MEEKRYPRTLYKSPGAIVWLRDKTYDSVIVQNEDEQKEVERAGFIDSLEDALAGKKHVPEPETYEPDDDDEDF